MTSNRSMISKGLSASAAVLSSRAAGLARDALCSRLIGGGDAMSAWVVAFTIPNLLRIFFGEGAANQSIIPLVSHAVEKDGKEKARRAFGGLFGSIGLFLAALTIPAGIACGLLSSWPDAPRVQGALALMPALMPYAIFVCLSGVAAGVLNLFGRFFMPATSSAILNILLIAVLLVSWGAPAMETVWWMSWVTLGSGLLQIAMMAWLMRKADFLPDSFAPVGHNDPLMKEFLHLALPGFIASAVFQINTIVDRSVALMIGDMAAPALYYAERLVYLPIGIFAVSMGNSAMVAMSKAAARGDLPEVFSSMRYGMRQILFVTIPSAAFLLVFREDLVWLIFGGAKFGRPEMEAAAWAILFYSFGIPVFGAMKLITAAFFSRKDTMTPMKVTALCVGLNFTMNMIFLCTPLRQGGIALASVLSATLNGTILLVLLSRAGALSLGPVAGSAVKVILSSAAAVASAYFAAELVVPNRICGSFASTALALGIGASVFAAAFALLNALLRCSEQREWLAVTLSPLKRRLFKEKR